MGIRGDKKKTVKQKRGKCQTEEGKRHELLQTRSGEMQRTFERQTGMKEGRMEEGEEQRAMKGQNAMKE